MIQGHGGNIYELARQQGCDPAEITDMSSNVNPLGPPPGLIPFLKDNLDRITALPEVDAGAVCQAFAARHELDPSRVIAGNGTTQLIYSLPRALASRQALVLAPTYADYADACAMNHVPCQFFRATAETGFNPSLPDMSAAIRKIGADLVFICNPNNPTGVMIPPGHIKNLAAEHPGVRFVVDEAYLPFISGSRALTLARPGGPDNVIVLNSMSKIFRVPGLRIGFAVAAPDLIERVAAYNLPWSVNSLSQAAVTWLMSHPDLTDRFIEETVDLLETEKDYLAGRLADNPVARPLPSATSFMLAALTEGHTAETVCDFLGQYRILIRNCANFEGLSSGFVRISLKTRPDNSRLADYLNKLT
ncbi:MAG: pyridoxal phosphate-dependent aminotransferase [Desulfosudaceae bacterium]